jgi:Fe-S cluster assembly ATP-binding protein
MGLLEVKDLSVKVEGKIILKDLNFSLKEKASHTLFGPNGSGKTTLISTLMGLPGYKVVSGQTSLKAWTSPTKALRELHNQPVTRCICSS